MTGYYRHFYILNLLFYILNFKKNPRKSVKSAKSAFHPPYICAMNEQGKLYLIPSSMGEGAAIGLPQYAIDVVHTLDTFIAERAKTARRFLKEIATPVPFGKMIFYELNKHTEKDERETFLDNIFEGKNIGLLSEAGCPGVADPGAKIVAMAHEMGVEVVPFVGPSSILLALMAAGMNGQQFAFTGYLPSKPEARVKALRREENQSIAHNQTRIFIETPYRNNHLIEDAIKHLSPYTRFCIAADLTLPTQFISSKTIQEWRENPPPDLHKRPAIFLIYNSSQKEYKAKSTQVKKTNYKRQRR